MGTTCSYSTSALLNGFEEQVFGCMEALEGITQFITDVRTAFFFDLRHTSRVMQQGVHRIEIERP